MQHYNWERPLKAADVWQCTPARGISRLTHLACPRHPRVDPDQWLRALDHQGFVRRVGRDGCVDVDLQTYYISSHMAGRQVFLQVEAAERHLVAWHADQVVTVLPIKGLMGQKMGIDNYLTHMRTRSAGTRATFNSSCALEPASASALVIEWRASQSKRWPFFIRRPTLCERNRGVLSVGPPRQEFGARAEPLWP